jgi:hypothetical protein
MNTTYVPALRLAGSVIGRPDVLCVGVADPTASEPRSSDLGEKLKRQKLYKQFIDEASKL